MIELVLDRVNVVTILVLVTVERQQVETVIDAGAEVTVLEEELFWKLPLN